MDSNYKALVLWNGKWTKMELEEFAYDDYTGETKYTGNAFPDDFMACEFCSVLTSNPPCAECTIPDEDREGDFKASSVPQRYLDTNMSKITDFRKLGKGRR